MNLLDPKLGGKVRAVIAILSAAAVVLTSLRAAHDVPWVASTLTVLNAVLAGLTHFTDVGNTDPKPAA